MNESVSACPFYDKVCVGLSFPLLWELKKIYLYSHFFQTLSCVLLPSKLQCLNMNFFVFFHNTIVLVHCSLSISSHPSLFFLIVFNEYVFSPFLFSSYTYSIFIRPELIVRNKTIQDYANLSTIVLYMSLIICIYLVIGNSAFDVTPV